MGLVLSNINDKHDCRKHHYVFCNEIEEVVLDENGLPVVAAVEGENVVVENAITEITPEVDNDAAAEEPSENDDNNDSEN